MVLENALKIMFFLPTPGKLLELWEMKRTREKFKQLKLINEKFR